jgi:hypothetical protein
MGMAKRLDPDHRQPVRWYADSYPDADAHSDTNADSYTDADPHSHAHTDAYSHADADRPLEWQHDVLAGEQHPWHIY